MAASGTTASRARRAASGSPARRAPARAVRRRGRTSIRPTGASRSPTSATGSRSLPPPREPELAHAGEPRRRGARRRCSRISGEAHVDPHQAAETMPSHRGEIAFPGGKRDAGRPDARRRGAAGGARGDRPGARDGRGRRRAGQPEHGRVPVHDHAVRRAARRAAGAAARTRGRWTLAFAVPISELLDPDVYREESWDLWGAWRPMAFFELPGETVWGATARILTSFLRFLTEARPRWSGPLGLRAYLAWGDAPAGRAPGRRPGPRPRPRSS